MVAASFAIDLIIGDGDGAADLLRHAARGWIDFARNEIHGELSGALAGGMTAEAVGDEEDPTFGVDQHAILIGGAFGSRIGSLSRLPKCARGHRRMPAPAAMMRMMTN